MPESDGVLDVFGCSAFIDVAVCACRKIKCIGMQDRKLYYNARICYDFLILINYRPKQQYFCEQRKNIRFTNQYIQKLAFIPERIAKPYPRE